MPAAGGSAMTLYGSADSQQAIVNQPLLRVPARAGRKSRIESFAGAKVTYTIEGMMGDGRALQVRLLADPQQNSYIRRRPSMSMARRPSDRCCRCCCRRFCSWKPSRCWLLCRS